MNDVIRFYGKIIKYGHSKDFRRQVLDAGHSTLEHINIKRNGNGNKGIIIYNLFLNDYAGFYCLFNTTLRHLWFSDDMGFVPVIRWGGSILYYEKEGVDGVFNPWEYYFMPVSKVSVNELRDSYSVVDKVNTEDKYLIDPYGRGVTDGSEMKELGRVYNKYIRLNDKIHGIINKDIDRLIGNNKVLGVHIRMGGMTAGMINHPIPAKIDEYIKTIEKVLLKKGYSYIYLASDDRRAVEAIVKEFGDKVLYYKETARVDTYIDTIQAKTDRKMHKYLCGLEVIRDVYTLGRCSGLVCGLSHVSYAARIYKESRDESFEDLEILRNGYYKEWMGGSRRGFERRQKKELDRHYSR